MKNKSKAAEKTDPVLRIPKAKHKFGLKIPKIPLPHDDLISPETPKIEVVPTTPSQTRQSSQTRK